MSSEQDWRALVNAEPACVETLSPEGEMLSMNLAGLNMIGAESVEQVPELNIFSLIDEVYKLAYGEMISKAVRGEPASLLFKGKTLLGKEMWYEAHMVPFPNVHGEITRVLEVKQDVTERVKSEKEKELLHYELQAARKMEALGHLTGGIAHDFNNLLAIIIGYSNLAKLEKEAHDIPMLFEYIERIEGAGERAKELIDQMLIFSRGDDSKRLTVKLDELIEEDLKILSAALPSSIKIESEIEVNLPAVSLNPGQFNQILMNLSINARDAMNGQGTLSIKLSMVEREGESCSACHKTIQNSWVELSITDTGSGIERETLERIFDPFFTTKGVGEGSGMGLAVVYGIIHKNGGHVLVETKKNVGTKFRILFPFLLDSSGVEQEQNVDFRAPPRGRGEAILIVDDEKSYGEFVKTLLDKNGYRTIYENDSRNALRLIENDPEYFSLLVTDQTMPELTGIELVKKVRQLSSNFPVIICSGYSEHFDWDKAQDMNVGYMAKPADIGKLLVMIHDTLNVD